MLWRLRVPEELEEVVTAELWLHGSLGVECRGTMLEAYFPAPLPEAARALDLNAWRRRGVEIVTRKGVASRDWLSAYRQGIEPLDIGSRFRIDQRLGRGEGTTSPPPEEDGRWTLNIPAQTAFGTGSHESTRLVVRWLEELDLTGLDVLDVGTGSGILSFASELLGARRVVGFDVDDQAVCIARHNAALNGMSPQFFSGRLAALRPTPTFDLALVNILPEHILGELSRLLPVLRPGARVVTSGYLVQWREELLAELSDLGLTSMGEKVENEWVAFLLAAPAVRR